MHLPVGRRVALVGAFVLQLSTACFFAPLWLHCPIVRALGFGWFHARYVIFTVCRGRAVRWVAACARVGGGGWGAWGGLCTPFAPCPMLLTKGTPRGELQLWATQLRYRGCGGVIAGVGGGAVFQWFGTSILQVRCFALQLSFVICYLCSSSTAA